MYPYQYLSNGGKLIFRSDSTKMYQITDNLGSVRSVVELNLHNRGVTIKSFDYKPFGDSLAGNDLIPRLGYDGEEKDKENSYVAMGARQYDPAIGRFLSVDPLFEKFTEQTTYQYAFNSPLTWKDPSGLEPKREKKDKIQAMLLPDLSFVYQMIQRLKDNQMQEFDNFISDFIQRGRNFGDETFISWMRTKALWSGGGGGGTSDYGGSNDRTGDQSSENGIKDSDSESNSDNENKKQDKGPIIQDSNTPPFLSDGTQPKDQDNNYVELSGKWSSTEPAIFDISDYFFSATFCTKGDYYITKNGDNYQLDITAYGFTGLDNLGYADVDFFGTAKLEVNNNFFEKRDFSINNKSSYYSNYENFQLIGGVTFTLPNRGDVRCIIDISYSYTNETGTGYPWRFRSFLGIPTKSIEIYHR
jgi:RHS repeat-associated protein